MPTQQVSLIKVVINKQDEVIKGVLESGLYEGVEDAVWQRRGGLPDVLTLRRPESHETFEASLSGAKAVFFVHEFEGKKQRRDLHFHNNAPVHDGVWVRVEFHDGEELEGLIYNSILPLIEPGFFLLPTDPGSNNRLIYVLKDALTNFCVLGVRQLSPL